MAGIGESWRGAAGLGEPERGGSRMRRRPTLAKDLTGPWRGRAPAPDGPSHSEHRQGAGGHVSDTKQGRPAGVAPGGS